MDLNKNRSAAAPFWAEPLTSETRMAFLRRAALRAAAEGMARESEVLLRAAADRVSAETAAEQPSTQDERADIRALVRLAGPDADSVALEREFKGSFPLSRQALMLLMEKMVAESRDVLDAVFQSRNVPPLHSEVRDRLVRHHTGLSGKELRERFRDLPKRQRFVAKAGRWAAGDFHRAEKRRRRLIIPQSELATQDDQFGDRALESHGAVQPVEGTDPEGRPIRYLAAFWAALDLVPDFVRAQGRRTLGRNLRIAELDLQFLNDHERLPTYEEVRDLVGFRKTHGRLVQIRKWYWHKVKLALAELGDAFSDIEIPAVL